MVDSIVAQWGDPGNWYFNGLLGFVIDHSISSFSSMAAAAGRTVHIENPMGGLALVGALAFGVVAGPVVAGAVGVGVVGGAIGALLGSAFFTATAAVVPRRWDPLALDLNGDGVVSTLGLAAGAHFDMDANGFAEGAGWIGSQDGLVVRDLNGNGVIDSGRELFGDQTLLPNGSYAANGFQALAALDSNADGKVDSQDAAWAELKVWRDLNSDGATDDGELQSLDSAGVASIGTGATATNVNDGLGNTKNFAGSFTRADGSTGAAANFLLARNTTDSVALDWVPVSDDILARPDLGRMGNVYSLQQAMARDPQLVALVDAAASGTDPRTLRSQFEQVLQRWTHADIVTPGSRGAAMDARRLAVLEAFYGQGFVGSAGANPIAEAAAPLNAAYGQVFDTLYAQFLAQTHLKSAWEAAQVTFDDVTGAATFDFGPSAGVLLGMNGAEPTANVQLVYEFGRSMATLGYGQAANTAPLRSVLAQAGHGYDAVFDAGLAGGAAPVIGSDAGEALTLSPTQHLAFGLSGNDTITGGTGDDILDGGGGNDVLDGGRGADILRGGAGDDTLGGAANSDDSGWVGGAVYSPGAGNTYEGGTGNDLLRGTALADLYLFNLGDGQDTIVEYENSSITGNKTDVLRFGAGIAPSDIAVSRNGSDLVLKVGASGTDQVTVKNWYTYVGSTNNQVERVEFADGTTWTSIDLTAQALVVTGTAGNDTLYGVGAFNDTLLGGAGNDQLFGYDGNDVLEGGDGNDVLDGGKGADVLRGGSGDDTLGGAANSDDSGWVGGAVYSPGAGNTYEGGTGNDLLRGTALADLYLFNLGDGQDTIVEYENASITGNKTDVLRFGAGIAPGDVTVTRNGTDLVLKVGAGGADQVTVKSWFTSVGSTNNQVERVEFADGTTWTNIDLTSQALVVTGTGGNDVLYGVGAFNDTLLGGAGNDQLFGYDGNDVLEGGDGNDVLDGGKGADILRGGAGDDTLGGAANSDDSGWVGGAVYSPGAGNTYEGGAGNDLLRGTALADLYLFNLGDGQDTIVEYENASITGNKTDVLRFGAGIAPGDVTVTRNGSDLVLAHVNGADRVTVKNWYTYAGTTNNQVERVEFADGTTWLAADLTAIGATLTGTAAGEALIGHGTCNNTLYGMAGNDTLTGGSAVDLLFGGAGNDTLMGGLGSDVYRYYNGDGYDTVSDSGGSSDLLQMDGVAFAALSFWRSGNGTGADLMVEYTAADGSVQGVKLAGQFASGGASLIEQFNFSGTTKTANDLAILAQPRP